MTLTSSRINDEFKLIQDILALCPGFDQQFKLYPDLSLMLCPVNGKCIVWERRANGQIMTIRSAARYILRRYW